MECLEFRLCAYLITINRQSNLMNHQTAFPFFVFCIICRNNAKETTQRRMRYAFKRWMIQYYCRHPSNLFLAEDSILS